MAVAAAVLFPVGIGGADDDPLEACMLVGLCRVASTDSAAAMAARLPVVGVQVGQVICGDRHTERLAGFGEGRPGHGHTARHPS